MAARILCLIIFILEVKGLSISLPRRKWAALVFYTQLANIVTVISALLLVIFGQHLWITNIRYLSTCMLVMTFLITICVLIPMGGDPKKLLWSGNGLYHHILCPVISTISYVFIENHAGQRMIWFPILITLLYGLVMLYLNAKNKYDGPYPFFRVHHQTRRATVLWIIVLLLIIAVISAVVMAVAR